MAITLENLQDLTDRLKVITESKHGYPDAFKVVVDMHARLKHQLEVKELENEIKNMEVMKAALDHDKSKEHEKIIGINKHLFAFKSVTQKIENMNEEIKAKGSSIQRTAQLAVLKAEYYLRGGEQQRAALIGALLDTKKADEEKLKMMSNDGIVKYAGELYTSLETAYQKAYSDISEKIEKKEALLDIKNKEFKKDNKEIESEIKDEKIDEVYKEIEESVLIMEKRNEFLDSTKKRLDEFRQLDAINRDPVLDKIEELLKTLMNHPHTRLKSEMPGYPGKTLFEGTEKVIKDKFALMEERKELVENTRKQLKKFRQLDVLKEKLDEIEKIINNPGETVFQDKKIIDDKFKIVEELVNKEKEKLPEELNKMGQMQEDILAKTKHFEESQRGIISDMIGKMTDFINTKKEEKEIKEVVEGKEQTSEGIIQAINAVAKLKTEVDAKKEEIYKEINEFEKNNEIKKTQKPTEEKKEETDEYIRKFVDQLKKRSELNGTFKEEYDPMTLKKLKEEMSTKWSTRALESGALKIGKAFLGHDTKFQLPKHLFKDGKNPVPDGIKLEKEEIALLAVIFAPEKHRQNRIKEYKAVLEPESPRRMGPRPR